MFVEACVVHLRDIARVVVLQRHEIENMTEPAKRVAARFGSKTQVSQRPQRGLQQSILEDVLCEIIETHLDRKQHSEPTPDLVIESDSTPHTHEGILLGSIPLED